MSQQKFIARPKLSATKQAAILRAHVQLQFVQCTNENGSLFFVAESLNL